MERGGIPANIQELGGEFPVQVKTTVKQNFLIIVQSH